MYGVRPRPTTLRGRTAWPPKIRRDPLEKNITHSWMYALVLANIKKEGDLCVEGWGCNRVKKKEERVLGTQKEKRTESPPANGTTVARRRAAKDPSRSRRNPSAITRRQAPGRRAHGRNAGPPKFLEKNTARSWMYGP